MSVKILKWSVHCTLYTLPNQTNILTPPPYIDSHTLLWKLFDPSPSSPFLSSSSFPDRRYLKHENETFSISSPLHLFYTLWICHIYTHLQTDLKRKATITINVPLFKKLRDIIFLGGENHFISDSPPQKKLYQKVS